MTNVFNGFFHKKRNNTVFLDLLYFPAKICGKQFGNK